MVRACRVCSARAWSCAGRSAASVGVAVARTRQWRSPVRHAFAVQFFAVQQSAKRTYSTVLYRISRADLAVCVPRRLVGAEAALAATAATVGTLHSIALIDMGRKPYSERSKELKNIRTMETLVPSNLLQDNNGCNQLVAPFNTECEISHTARSSSDSRTDYDGGPPHTATATISDPTWKPSSSHDLQPTWALPLTAWVEQRHALGDVQIHATGAEIRTSAGGNGAARASSHLKLPQQAAEHAAAAHGSCEQHTLNRVERGATGGPSAASAAEDPKRALVHALQNDLSRMSVLLERLDKLLSA